ncbi:hypothetical protein LEP1GSC062_2770 [Leptospira alexanderi serovar Manhao 3 str. L 60]|uniref:Uncharacterized protein n=1 Tax=Leptospira alexanderi serovar Manhao 3 str. L 60 TaxID=1049759 RepID=V6I236_9LEPT|nr:hypothetical protein LEP1GSC062_2770 [Leptospira alexanderi serovar Manhao 3 str. L 60]
MGKNFLKAEIHTISEFVRKIVICGSSHILRIDLQSSDPTLFRKMNRAELTLKNE